jgi:hypothetical protein
MLQKSVCRLIVSLYYKSGIVRALAWGGRVASVEQTATPYIISIRKFEGKISFLKSYVLTLGYD